MSSKRNITAFLILILSLSACATNGKNVNVYTRDDVVTKGSKVIVFPMLLARKNGMKAANSKYVRISVKATECFTRSRQGVGAKRRWFFYLL